MDANLPIDIHCGKMLDWLVSRRHVQKNWNVGVMAVRAKLQHAIEDMPEHADIVQLLSGAHINYFHCLRIVEILRETEKDTKNMFGSYSSQRMKDWLEIVSMYKTDNVYLGEGAALLQRMVQYEVPALKRQSDKAAQMAEESDRKSVDYARQEKDALRQFAKECEEKGISSSSTDSLRVQLLHLAADIPQQVDAIADQTKALQPAIQYYDKCRKVQTGKTSSLPLLEYVIEHGNVTYYEWHYGVKPSQVVPLDLLASCQVEDEGDDVIDFGTDDTSSADIDFADDLINYGIEVDGAATPVQDELVNTSSPLDTIARNEEALSLLEHRITSQMLRDELLELLTFMRVRETMLTSEHASDILLAKQIAANHGQMDVGEKVLKTWIKSCTETLAAMSDENRRHLCKIRIDQRYVDSLVDKLESKRALSVKYARLAELSVEKKAECREEILAIKPKIATLLVQIKQLQKHIESDISQRYSNRPVNIMGMPSK